MPRPTLAEIKKHGSVRFKEGDYEFLIESTQQDCCGSVMVAIKCIGEAGIDENFVLASGARHMTSCAAFCSENHCSDTDVAYGCGLCCCLLFIIVPPTLLFTFHFTDILFITYYLAIFSIVLGLICGGLVLAGVHDHLYSLRDTVSKNTDSIIDYAICRIERLNLEQIEKATPDLINTWLNDPSIK